MLQSSAAMMWKGCPVVHAPHRVVERVVHDKGTALRCLVAGIVPACRIVGRCLRVSRGLAGERLGAANSCTWVLSESTSLKSHPSQPSVTSPTAGARRPAARTTRLAPRASPAQPPA